MQARSHRTSSCHREARARLRRISLQILTESIESKLRLSELSVLTDKVGCGIRGIAKKRGRSDDFRVKPALLPR
jgi:hypothetical protein